MDKKEYIEKQITLTENCPHECTRVRYRKASNGALMYKPQCVRCGALVGNWIPHCDLDKNFTYGPIDDNLSKIYSDNALSLRRELLAIEKNERATEYSEYLMTENWRAKRRAVFERCGQVCEGCRERKATEVHHITYEHIYDEFLFELVGLCNECHSRMHAGVSDAI